MTKNSLSCALIHHIEKDPYLLMIKNNEGVWTLPNRRTAKDCCDKELGKMFKRTTSLPVPEINNVSILQNGGSSVYVGSIGHIDTSKFKKTKYSNSIGFISLDMLRKNKFLPNGSSLSIEPQTAELLKNMDGSDMFDL